MGSMQHCWGNHGFDLLLSGPLLGQDLEKVMWMTQRGAVMGCRLHSNFVGILYGR